MIEKLIALFGGGALAKTADGVVNIAALATLAPVALWFLHHKDEIAVSLTWGQGAILGGILFFVVKLAHYTRAPG